MNSNQKLSYAIAAILSGSAMGVVHAAPAADTSDSEGIQEITVTAQRRSENMQDVRRLHQIRAKRHHGQPRTWPEQHLHARA
jgi:hypothetical protein